MNYLLIISIIAAGAAVISLIQSLKNKQTMAKTKAEFDETIGGIRTDAANVKADVSGLKTRVQTLEDALANAGMTAAEESEVFTALQAVKDEMAALAGETPDAPAEPEEPGTEETEA